MNNRKLGIYALVAACALSFGAEAFARGGGGRQGGSQTQLRDGSGTMQQSRTKTMSQERKQIKDGSGAKQQTRTQTRTQDQEQLQDGSGTMQHIRTQIRTQESQ